MVTSKETIQRLNQKIKMKEKVGRRSKREKKP